MTISEGTQHEGLKAFWDHHLGRQPKQTEAARAAGGDMMDACLEHNAYVGVPRLARASVMAMVQYARILRLNGLPLPTFLSDQHSEWLPLSVIGPIVIVVHFDPAACASLPLPRELAQMVIVPPEVYSEINGDMRGQGDFLGSIYNDTPGEGFLRYREWLKAHRGDAVPDPRSALAWLLEFNLISEAEAGSALSASKGEGKVSDLSQDLNLAINHLLFGWPIGRRDILRFAAAKSPTPTPFNPEKLEKLQCYPFWTSPKAVAVMVADPRDRLVDDTLAGCGATKLLKVACTKQSIISLFQEPGESHNYDAGPAAVTRHAPPKVSINQAALERFNPRNSEDAPLTVQFILNEAVRRRASDIHIEAFGEEMRVRLAVDNTGVILLRLPVRRITPISQLLKGFCNVAPDGTSHEEGRFSFEVSGRLIDVRASLLIVRERSPKWTLRLFDKDMGVKTLAQLGLSADDLAVIRKALHHPYGLFLVSGPTGHGKSTTLYAGLTELNTPGRFIYTLEDPIEYEIDGINQVAVSSDPEQIQKGALSFYDGVKRILRADPEVIMIGEMRDAATAGAGLQASNTGHMVISTVHANNCATVLSRMAELGVDQRLMSDALVMVSSQRLLRRLCSCHGHMKPTEEMVRQFECHRVRVPQYVYVPGGCENCSDSGYLGRVVVMETLPITQAVREAIGAGRPSTAVMQVAREHGFQSLYAKGLGLVARGVTSLDEVRRHCPSSEE